MPGHPSGDGVNAVADIDTVVAEDLGQLDQFVLSLGCGESEAPAR